MYLYRIKLQQGKVWILKENEWDNDISWNIYNKLSIIEKMKTLEIWDNIIELPSWKDLAAFVLGVTIRYNWITTFGTLDTWIGHIPWKRIIGFPARCQFANHNMAIFPFRKMMENDDWPVNGISFQVVYFGSESCTCHLASLMPWLKAWPSSINLWEKDICGLHCNNAPTWRVFRAGFPD